MNRRILVAAGLALMLLLMVSSLALGADPSAVPDPLLGGDPRSDGAGPGIVGSPLLILGAVIVLGFATAVVTIVIARLAQRR